MNWIYYSIIALFTGMFAQIIIKYLLIKQIKTIDIILLLSLLNGVFSLIYYIIKKFNKKKFNFKLMNLKYFICILLICIFSFICAYSIIKGIDTAPNPGYAVAITSTSFVFMSIICYFLYGSHLTYKSFIGLIIILIGFSFIIKFS